MHEARSKFAIFRAGEAPTLEETDAMSVPPLSETVAQWFVPVVESGQLGGGTVRVLFREPGENGLSLIHAWFKPNYVLPRHSHSADCLYYVVAGTAILGNQVLKAGDGFFVPADQPYAYRAGEDGVEVLEFRAARNFDIRFSEMAPEAWQKIIDSARENRERWELETTPPSWR